MKTLQHGLAIGLALAVALAIDLSWREIPLPDPARVEESIKLGRPIQAQSDAPPFTAAIDRVTYAVTPRARYDLAGVVVSYHRGDALLNMHHADDPGNIQDVCVVWGDNVANGSYRRVSYSSGEFTCYYQWSGSLDPPFDPSQMSNNHLIRRTASSPTASGIRATAHRVAASARILVPLFPTIFRSTEETRWRRSCWFTARGMAAGAGSACARCSRRRDTRCSRRRSPASGRRAIS